MTLEKKTPKVKKSSSEAKKKDQGFTAEEKVAMKERAKELKAEAKANKSRAEGEKAVLEKIAEMAEPDRKIAKRVHKIEYMENRVKMNRNLPKGYLAKPVRNNGKKILVLHAWWGLNETIKNYCDRFADEGFFAFAPDLYHGKLTDEIEQAEVFSNELSLEQARSDIEEALRFIDSQSSQKDNKVAIIGFSLGAYLALDASILFPEQIDKVVIVYGDGPDDYSKATASYQAHFAEFDPYEPESNREELEKAFKKSNRPYSYYVYPKTGHWFCEPDRMDAYNQEAAKLVWERTLAFLTQP